MPIRIFAGTILLAALVPPLFPARAAVRIGEAEVREGPRGGPCFTIAAREERQGAPDFRAVTVWDGQRLMWKMTLPRERSFPLTFGMCVPYGGKVAALPRTTAAELEPGKVYYLHIDARAGTGHATPLAYDARFCLARQRNGPVVVHRIANDTPPAQRADGCLGPAD